MSYLKSLSSPLSLALGACLHSGGSSWPTYVIAPHHDQRGAGESHGIGRGSYGNIELGLLAECTALLCQVEAKVEYAS